MVLLWSHDNGAPHGSRYLADGDMYCLGLDVTADMKKKLR